jgi:hypothetical protein
MIFPYRNMPIGFVPPQDNAMGGELVLFLFMMLGFFIMTRAGLKAGQPRDRF